MVLEKVVYVDPKILTRAERERKDKFELWHQLAIQTFIEPIYRLNEINDEEIDIHFTDPRVHPNIFYDKVNAELKEFVAKNENNLMDNPDHAEILHRAWRYCGFWVAGTVYPFKNEIFLFCPELYPPAKQMGETLEKKYNQNVSLLLNYPSPFSIKERLRKFFRR